MKRDPDNILLQTPCLIHLPIQFAARWEEAAIGGAEHLQHVEQADDAPSSRFSPSCSSATHTAVRRRLHHHRHQRAPPAAQDCLRRRPPPCSLPLKHNDARKLLSSSSSSDEEDEAEEEDDEEEATP